MKGRPLNDPSRAKQRDCAPVYSVRRAVEQDGAEIARLAGQLGYPCTPEAMASRLRRLRRSRRDAVFVAGQDGELAGWIHGMLSQYLESDFRVEIAGLVVDKRFQRLGIGRALVAIVEKWGLSSGAVQSVVRCRTTRPAAHRFYESLGYNRSKKQIVFRKSF